MRVLSDDFDMVVYRATPAGIIAAITAARLGLRVLLAEPSGRIGGMMTSGLCATDIVNDTLINGVALEFFRNVRDHYGLPYLPARTESRVARAVFQAMLDKSSVRLECRTDITMVSRGQDRITGCRLSNGRDIRARWWVDASYEGDLIALAGLPFRLGRESQDEFGEPLAGRQPYRSMLPWPTGREIAPHDDKGLLPFVQPPSWRPVGAGDDQVQSYCIRPTLTNRPENRVPIRPPEDFDPAQFELFRRLGQTLRSGRVAAKDIPQRGITYKSAYFNFAELPNGKFDMNSGPAAPLNNPALTEGWVTATAQQRLRMTEAFRRYTLGLLHFMQNDASVPKGVRDFLADFGLPADEYTDSGNFPPDVYVREGRRLQGERIFRQQDVESGGATARDALCEAKYHLDCKPVHWRVNHSGRNIVRERMFFTQDAHRYGLPAWIILPRSVDCQNFFAVCGVSASHVAFGSIRMEPTWMELGMAAAIMAHMADRQGCTPHDLTGSDVTRLRDERFFQWPAPRFLGVKLRDRVSSYYRKVAGG